MLSRVIDAGNMNYSERMPGLQDILTACLSIMIASAVVQMALAFCTSHIVLVGTPI